MKLLITLLTKIALSIFIVMPNYKHLVSTKVELDNSANIEAF